MMRIIRTYKEGSFHYVEVIVGYTKSYVRETYTHINYSWYKKTFTDLHVIDKKCEFELESEYKKIKNKGKRQQKLKRILK